MGQEDVNNPAGSSPAETEGNTDETRKLAADGSEIPDGDKSKTPRDIPYSRFKEVNDQAKKASEIVDWYRQNIGDPDDVIAFKKYKTDQLEKAKEKEKEGDITPEKLAAIRKLLRQADPEINQLLEERKQSEQNRIDAQYEDAEEQIRDFIKTAGLPQDEKIINRIAVHIMDEIKSDPKLMRQWQIGNMKCVGKAWEQYSKEYLEPMRKVSAKSNSDLAARRSISRLPSLPSGGSASTSKAPERKPGDKGITKQTHEDAWALVSAHMNE